MRGGVLWGNMGDRGIFCRLFIVIYGFLSFYKVLQNSINSIIMVQLSTDYGT